MIDHLTCVTRELKRPDCRLVDCNMVGMTIAADRVKGQHHLWLDLADIMRYPRRHLIQRIGEQSLGMLVIRRAGHA